MLHHIIVSPSGKNCDVNFVHHVTRSTYFSGFFLFKLEDARLKCWFMHGISGVITYIIRPKGN